MGNDRDAYRVYNHTDRELIIATDDNKQQQYRLLPRGISPRSETPLYLWEADGEKIDGATMWQLVRGYDVHVSQTAAEATVGATAPRSTTVGPAPMLHIAGLGTIATQEKPPETTAKQAWFYGEDDIWVTVLGAGITGLTVAHELVTRGFRVQVIERAHGSPADITDGDTGLDRFRRGLRTPDIGGIARTQWATQPLARAGEGGLGVIPTGSKQLESLHSIHGDAIWFGADSGGVQMIGQGDYQSFGVTWTNDTLDEFAEPLEDWLRGRGKDRSVAAVQLVVVVYGGSGEDRVAHAYRRLYHFLAALADADATQDKPVASLRATLDRLQVLPTARIDVPEPEPGPGSTYVGLIVRVHEDLGLIAGEHGFRFFPGFYRHLRDTMQRTPIFDPVTQTFTPRTALDNLQEVAWQVIVDPRRRSRLAVSRKPFNTLGGLIEQYQTLRRDTGYRPIDLLRYSLRMLRYMTSSTQRRATYYENMSWWTFLSKRHLDDPRDETPFAYGERFARALRHLPRALVAMDPERADARTLGNISVQLVMDQFGLHDQSDSTLTGPTSTSWLSHWRRFLEEQGVRFFLGEVTRIDIDGENGGRARVDITFADLRTPAEYLDGEVARRNGLIAEHYIVSALDLSSLVRVAHPLRALKQAGVFSDLGQLVTDRDHADRDLEDITAIGHGGEQGGLDDRFQTLSGIQLYYEHHVSFANGHIYFAESPWGLSAISQVQFWGPFGTGHRGRLTGNLSVDIGSWRADGTTPDPNQLARDDIATLVQDQINRPADEHKGLMARARYYHLDDFIGLGPVITETGEHIMAPRRNYAPFLINRVSDWSSRPRGEPWSPNEPEAQDREPGSGTANGYLWTPARGGYVVHFGNLVVAGTHMRTFTRMTTMEAANESARHAVNTILDHASYRWQVSQSGGLEAPVRLQPTPNINVNKSTTPFGDYCDIWNPEHLELQDLDFLRAIDEQLMDAGSSTNDDVPPGTPQPIAPHLFDILRIDELPDLLEGDREVLNALELIGAILKAFDAAQGNDLSSVLAMVDGARKKLAALFHRAAK